MKETQGFVLIRKHRESSDGREHKMFFPTLAEAAKMAEDHNKANPEPYSWEYIVYPATQYTTV